MTLLARVRQRFEGVSGGMFGLFLLGIGALLWLSADLRDEWRKLDALDRHLAETARLPVPASSDAPGTETNAGGVPRGVARR